MLEFCQTLSTATEEWEKGVQCEECKLKLVDKTILEANKCDNCETVCFQLL